MSLLLIFNNQNDKDKASDMSKCITFAQQKQRMNYSLYIII